MWDCVLPWCFLANSALASPPPRADFKCAGSALFKEEVMLVCVCFVVGGNAERELLKSAETSLKEWESCEYKLAVGL